MITIQGEIEEIIFRNEINGYTVCTIKYDEKTATLIGYMVSASIGETVKASGKWINHPSYGEQFKAELCERQMPKTENSIVKFLGSGIIKGIREATAKKIINKFGTEALDIIENNPHKLAEIKGITIEKGLLIGQAFHEYKHVWDISVFLQQFGISPLFVNKIYRQFGEDTIKIVKANPYRLADEISGIGFKKVDDIALSLGADPSSEDRIASCIKYILVKSAVKFGHTYQPEDKIKEYAADLLNVNQSLVGDAIISLAVNGKVVLDTGSESQKIFLKSLNQAELNVSKRLIGLFMTRFDKTAEDLSEYISEIQKEQGIILVEEQKKAVMESLRNGVTVITGGPGTGKTTIIKSVVQMLEKMDLTYALAAPTGRAAKRLSEASGREAKTIHRLLELGKSEDGVVDVLPVNRNTPFLTEDVVIIDEASMVDIILMNHLVNSITDGTRLIMVGDVDQLPAVGPGNVLKDIISSDSIKVVRLTEIFRQAKESMIVVNAHRINKGEYPQFNTSKGDFFIARNQTYEKILEDIISICSLRLPKYKDYDPFKDIQVISPTKKGIIGTKNLNNELQKVLNPENSSKAQKNFMGTVFREGDKIMQIKNNYELIWQKSDGLGQAGCGIFNGDIGKIIKITEDDGSMTVLYDDREVIYYEDIMDEVELAYAVTVHKSQGSEFPVLIMPLLRGMPILTTRNLLYTAITRAKEMVIVVGLEEDVRAMVDNFKEIKRYSGLADKLKAAAVCFSA